ncbi:hypothetical protein [Streptomyces sp. NPDC002104]
MRKALTFSAIALASSMALAVPTAAFAADATPAAHGSASADAKTAPVALKLSSSSGKPGDSVRMSMEVPDGSTNLSISSEALNNVKMTDGRGATATIAKVADGTYGISLTGTGPKGEKLQATAQITVKDGKTAPVALKVSSSSGKPGDSVRMSMEVPDGSTNLSISSEALNNVKMTDGRGATATIAKVADGTYGISLTGTGPKGEKLQATAQITVKDGKPAPTPGASTLSLSQDHGKPGEKIQVTIKTSPNEKSAFIKSDAFGGQVNLKNDGKGVWTGTAVVAKNVKSGYYGVDAFAGGKKFDTVKFSTDATGPVNPKPAPLDPSHHKTPKGSVNTGQAPLGWVPSDAADNG